MVRHGMTVAVKSVPHSVPRSPTYVRLNMFDKFKEECGVFGILNHPDAANLVYLGLYALQHRGQESAGIASVVDHQIISEKEMGKVVDVFTPERLSRLPGDTAIGHVRYST